MHWICSREVRFELPLLVQLPRNLVLIYYLPTKLMNLSRRTPGLLESAASIFILLHLLVCVCLFIYMCLSLCVCVHMCVEGWIGAWTLMSRSDDNLLKLVLSFHCVLPGYGPQLIQLYSQGPQLLSSFTNPTHTLSISHMRL